MVELDSLENCCAGNCTVGSNPTLSAIFQFRAKGGNVHAAVESGIPFFALPAKDFSTHPSARSLMWKFEPISLRKSRIPSDYPFATIFSVWLTANNL